MKAKDGAIIVFGNASSIQTMCEINEHIKKVLDSNHIVYEQFGEELLIAAESIEKLGKAMDKLSKTLRPIDHGHVLHEALDDINSLVHPHKKIHLGGGGCPSLGFTELERRYMESISHMSQYFIDNSANPTGMTFPELQAILPKGNKRRKRWNSPGFNRILDLIL